MKLIRAVVRKIGYYLSVAYYDIGFRTVFSILVLKLLLFDHNAKLGIFSISFFPDLGMILLFLSPALIMREGILKYSYLFLLDCLYSLIFFGNSLFLHYFRNFISANDVYQAPLLLHVSDAVMALIHNEYFFVADLVLLPLFFLFLKRNNLKKDDRYGFNFGSKLKAVGIMLLMAIYCNYIMLSHMPEITHPEAHVTEDRALQVVRFGIMNYQIFDGYEFVAADLKRHTVTAADIASAKAWLKANSKKTPQNCFTGVGKGFNVIVIQAESLQNFVIGTKFEGRDITSHLNALAETGIYFDNTFDQAWDGNSSDATLLANSSLYPAKTGAAACLHAKDYFDSLPKVLEEHGYATAAMHANVRTFWNSLQFEKALGFEKQFYKKDFVLTEKIGWGLSDRAFFSQSLEKIERLPQPFYVFLRTLTTHFPFAYVSKDIDPFPLGEVEGTLIGGYIRSMHYLDSTIGDFLQELAESGLLSRTIIVVYGDHRARLSEEDLRRAGVADMREKAKIPLIISIPGEKHREVRHTIGGLVDVTPTLCNILGIDISGKFFLGKDLGNNVRGYAIFRDGSFISPDGMINSAQVEEELRINDLILEKNVLGAMEAKKG
jgi:lipoteichoic acid synthase